jgi:hypothetical protein
MEFVIDAYHRLWHIEKKLPDVQARPLQARPIYHHPRESIEAHLSIGAARWPSVHYIESQTGWNINKFLRTTCRRCRTVENQSWQTRS